MKKYFDTILSSETGLPISGVQIYVRDGSNALASLYADDGSTPTGNPVTTDDLGRYEFYVADGNYRLEPYVNGSPAGDAITDIEIISAENLPRSAATRDAMAALNGATVRAVIVVESGHEGTWIWSSSNLSAQVTADPTRITYVAPLSDPTGATGAWVKNSDTLDSDLAAAGGAALIGKAGGGTVQSFITAVGSSAGSAGVGFLQSGTGAVARTAQAKMRDFVSVQDFGAVGDGVTNDTSAIQAAITAHQNIWIPPGTYLITGTLTVPSNRAIWGAGVAKTTLKKTTASTGHVIDIIGTSAKSNIHLKGFTIDVNSIDSGIVMEYIEDSLFEDLYIKNIPYWGIQLGVQNGADTVIRNKRNVFRNISFENGTQTYEHFLLFNAEDTIIDGFFAKTGSNAIALGLYQNVDRFTLQNFRIESMKTAIYYSVSTRDIRIVNGLIRSTTSGIQGANKSDNGLFGYTYAEMLHVERVKFTGNTDCGISLGALYRYRIVNCEFERNNSCAILFTDGGIGITGTGSARRANDGVIENCWFIDNNESNISSINAPGISFTAIGGDMALQIKDCVAVDNRGTPRQLYPIAFVGAFAWSNVRVRGGTLNAYSGATSIGSSGVTSIDVELEGRVRGLTTSLATGVTGAVYVGSATYDPANLADGAGVTTTVTVTGAALGDEANTTFSLDLQGITLTSWVSGANTVSVRFQNETGGAIDLASGTLVATTRRPRTS